MNTHRIDKVDGEAICTGFKVLDWSFRANLGDGYCYADENGNVEGSIHTTEGELRKCENGLHFCKNPLDCMSFYSPVQWNKFVAVTAFGEVIDDAETGKSVARTLRIDKVLTYSEYIDAIKTYTKYEYDLRIGNNIQGSQLIQGGCDIHGGSSVYGGENAYGVRLVFGGDVVYGGYYVSGGNYVYGGNNVYGVRNVYGCKDVFGTHNVKGGYSVWYSEDVYGGESVYGGRNVYGSKDIHGGDNVIGCNSVWYCRRCEGISRCILCYGIEGGRLKLFNKDISEKRFIDVREEIFNLADGWQPKFTNADELRMKYGNGRWEATPAPAISQRSEKEAYADMPVDLVKYIKSLPEYDEAIFNAITLYDTSMAYNIAINSVYGLMEG